MKRKGEHQHVFAYGVEDGQHGFRYTQSQGKARMKMKAELIFACMNLKKLAKILAKKEQKGYDILHSLIKVTKNFIYAEKRCWNLTPARTLSTI